MSQFMLIERETETRGLSDVLLSMIPTEDDFVREVATEYFGDWQRCRLATDLTGRGEPLVDDVCDAQLAGNPIEDTTFVRFLGLLVEARVPFVIWHGNDYHDLPTAGTWFEVLEQVRAQTKMQPADVYLHFGPPFRHKRGDPEPVP